MGRIGRRYKGKMQGSSSYIKKSSLSSPPPTTAPAHPPSVKRQRVHYKRQGSHHIPINLSQELQTNSNNQTSYNTSLRLAICHHFIYELDVPHTEEWGGKDGTISLIRKKFKMPPHTRRKIRRTLDGILLCIRRGEEFEGSLGKSTGRKVIIESGSVDEELIARWMADHVGFRMCTMLVNEHRREEGKERVGVNTVVNAFYRLKPKINIIEKV